MSIIPRLSAELGEVTLSSLEREKREEKEQEEALRKKIRELKIKIAAKRRENPGNREQPANKKRKLETGHKRVLQEDKRQEKRMTENIEEAENKVREKEKLFPIFKKARTLPLSQRKSKVAGEKQSPRKTEEQLQEEWDEHLRRREQRLREEQERRRPTR